MIKAMTRNQVPTEDVSQGRRQSNPLEHAHAI